MESLDLENFRKVCLCVSSRVVHTGQATLDRPPACPGPSLTCVAASQLDTMSRPLGSSYGGPGPVSSGAVGYGGVSSGGLSSALLRAPTPSRGVAASLSSGQARSTSAGRGGGSSSGGAGLGSGVGLAARERRAAVERLDPDILSELREAFQLFDSDEDGAIGAKELRAAFKALGVDVKAADVRRMLAGASDCVRGERALPLRAVTRDVRSR